MRFLITGITGFVGPHLANLLIRENHQVFGLIRGSNGRQSDLLDVMSSEDIQKVQWLYGDITEYHSLEKIFKTQQFNGVFHLAAQSHPPTSFLNPILTYNTNVMGTVNLIFLIQEYQSACRLHFCSTSEVYGDDCKEKGELFEDMDLHPINPYAASKAAIDLYVQERIRNGFIDGFITRAFSHTGPRRGSNFSISSDAYQIAEMKKGLQDYILLIGNLKTKRVVMDVRDCVSAYYKLMMKKSTGVFNVCGNDVYPMQHFTDLLIQASGLKGITQRIHKPYYRPIDIQIQIGNTEKLRKEINWTPTITIEKTMTDLLDYWLKKIG